LKRKGYISGKFLVRLLVVVVLTGTAWVFDHYYKGDKKVLDEIERSGSEKSTESLLFYYNPTAQVSCKHQSSRLQFKRVFFESENKFLVRYHSVRAYHFLKEEPIVFHRSIWLTQHNPMFRHPGSDNPDDLPDNS